MSKHCLLSPSSSNRWMECTASPLASKDEPRTSNKYADEGTCAHHLLEEQINGKTRSQAQEALKDNQYYIDHFQEEMFAYLQPGIEYITEQRDQGNLVYAEEVYEIPVTEGFGTVDITIVNIDKKEIEIADLKYGKTKVDPKENSQLMLYAYGAYMAWNEIIDIKTFKLTVFQPRLKGFSSWNIKVKDLLEWINYKVWVKAHLALNGNGDFKPGRWCWFCPIKDKCDALKNLNANKDFDDDYEYEEEI